MAKDSEQTDPIGEVVHYAVRYPHHTGGEIEVISVSPNVVEVFGYDLAAWDHLEDQWLQMLHRADYSRAVSASYATSRLGTPYSIEYRVIKADGTEVWIRDEATVEQRDADETWRGTFAIIETPSAWEPGQLGPRIVSIIGRARALDLVNALDRPHADLAELIDTLNLDESESWLQDLLRDLGPDEPARTRLAEGLRLELGEDAS
jgi:PAS fold